uniref:Uncharacterized protein n=1 Tax=Panagrolaimus superbus TaxID=310955 RepID=A0A914Z5T7_9BILA
MKLPFSRRRREDADIKAIPAHDEIPHPQILQNYVAKHDSHRGGYKKPSVDFDTVLKETIPFNSTDYA